jgi:NADP-dependent 3-hydroxy acid dehydrogenase YdfG
VHPELPHGLSDPLRGLSVLITGGSSGIGLATAEAMVARGARVAMVARSRDVLEREAERIGGQALIGDMTSATDVERVRASLVEMIGAAPDILVNAAGFFSIETLAETSFDDFDRNVAVNLKAPFLLLRAFLPAMKARGSGHIVNVGSVAGRLAFPGNGAYSASKFGLRGLHEVLAAELAGTGIRASLVEPAATDTPLWDPVDPDEREGLPSRASMLSPADVARAIVFITSQPPGVEISTLGVRSVR